MIQRLENSASRKIDSNCSQIFVVILPIKLVVKGHIMCRA